ncbi:DUF4345 domain-containing protein [Tenacibaculum agarivorans]|uniref:DUF4345 domain-containing protein n=1 Tax=Tenacibaculum agarivorans TaxID=1908389 RepID=UPI00094B7AE7|nr:DUF4345 domain-containing protein [Tenacibaculum agarivorans]
MPKKLQLIISAVVVICVSFVYGFNPSKILPNVFGFEVESLELKNIFRAIMGLYIFLGVFWLIGVWKEELWKSATLSNIVFMEGLAFGRSISIVVDGVSVQFLIATILEFLTMLWGIYNLKKYGNLNM